MKKTKQKTDLGIDGVKSDRKGRRRRVSHGRNRTTKKKRSRRQETRVRRRERTVMLLELKGTADKASENATHEFPHRLYRLLGRGFYAEKIYGIFVI